MCRDGDGFLIPSTPASKVKPEKGDVGDTRGKSIHAVAKLSGSQRFTDTMTELREFVQQRVTSFICGPAEADPEYQLIVRANNLAAEIDHEMYVTLWLRTAMNRSFARSAHSFAGSAQLAALIHLPARSLTSLLVGK